MRTVDPDLWSREIRKPPLNISRPFQFGLKGLSPCETRLRKSFCDAMLEFYRNCSVEGVAYVADRNNPKILRWCYLLAVLVTTGAGIALLVSTLSYFGTSPRLCAWEQRGAYAARREDFPAVAICSFNLISRFALEEYAQHVYSLDRNNTYSLEEIKKNLVAYGAVHSRRPVPFDFHFESYLEKVAHETNVTNILYKAVIFQLTPDCGRLLARCSWEARRVGCARLFAKRITSAGFCCVFNSRYHSMDKHNPVYASRLAGEDSGLAVVVRERPDDITKLRRPIDGFDVYMFDGWQYPAARAGVVVGVPAPHGAMVDVQLKPRLQVAGPSLWGHTDDWLGCRLSRNKENPVTPWSWCVGACRSRAAEALCRCAPHTLPPFYSNTSALCSLQHVTCIAKYSDKLSWLYPGDSPHASLREEMENSVECEDCVAECARVVPRAHSSVSPLSALSAHKRHMFYNHLLKGLDLTNSTVVRLFFTSEDREFFVLETSLRMYGVVAFLGSQWVLVVGVTAVSVLELLYHCVCRWSYHYVRRLRMERLVQ